MAVMLANLRLVQRFAILLPNDLNHTNVIIIINNNNNNNNVIIMIMFRFAIVLNSLNQTIDVTNREGKVIVIITLVNGCL